MFGRRRRRGPAGCLVSLLLTAMAIGIALFGLMFLRNSGGLRTRVQANPVVNRVLDVHLVERVIDSGLVNRVRNSDLLHRVRHADLADQVNIDPEILRQVREHGTIPNIPSASANCPEPLILSAEWGNHDGGHSVAVTPSDCVRSSGLAMRDQVWDALVALDQEASGPGMRDQLVCHMIGAQDKPTWNLEPWRPAVGLQQTILNLCNP